MRKSWFAAALAAAAALTAVTALPAWWVKGHESIAEAAAAGLPDEVPAFFRAAGKHLAHFAGEPDRWKNPSAKHLKAGAGRRRSVRDATGDRGRGRGVPRLRRDVRLASIGCAARHDRWS